MRNLPAKELHAILGAVMRLHEVGTLAQFARFSAEATARLIRADVVSVTEWSPANGHRTFYSTRNLWTQGQRRAAETLLPDHPLVVHLGTHQVTGPIALSDVISDREWRRHPFYRQVWRPHGIFRSLHLTLPLNRHHLAAVSLDRRGRDFADRERARLAAFAPHIIATWRRLQQAARPASRGIAARMTFDQAGVSPVLRELGLSRRETEVLWWIIEGKQNREVATILGVSLRTVQKHVEHMLSRLGMENRHSLTVQALRHLATA